MDLDFRKIVSRHLVCEVKTDINDFDTCEMQCYTESTADGYDVYVLKYTQDEVSVTENIITLQSEPVYSNEYYSGEIVSQGE